MLSDRTRISLSCVIALILFVVIITHNGGSSVSAKPTNLFRAGRNRNNDKFVATNMKKAKSLLQYLTPIAEADRWVTFLSVVNDLLNGNSSLNSVDRVASMLADIGNSYGWAAWNSFINTAANFFTIYDAMDGAADRTVERVQNIRNRKSNTTEKPSLKKLKSSLDHIVVELISINQRLRCRLLFPMTNETNNNLELVNCLEATLVTNEDYDDK